MTQPALQLIRTGLATPDRLAMSVIGLSRADRWSYARLHHTILSMAGAMRASGLAPGDVLVFAACDRPEHAIAFLAATAAGLLPVTDPSKATHHPTATLLLSGETADTARPRLDLRELAQGQPLDDFDPGTSPTGNPFGLTAQDRMLITGGTGMDLLTTLFATWAQGAAALVPGPATTPAQWPLLASRHGATVLAVAHQELDQLMAQDWKPWPALRQAVATDAVPDDLAARWQDRTGLPLLKTEGLAPPR